MPYDETRTDQHPSLSLIITVDAFLVAFNASFISSVGKRSFNIIILKLYNQAPWE